MKLIAAYFLSFLFILPSLAQNTIGLPLIINFNKTDFHGGVQTWDIRQDSKGLMYFANNDGLITYDGSYWKVYSIPNKTILRSIAIDKNDRIYVGAQNEFGYFAPDKTGTLVFNSLKPLLPKNQVEFADIWDTEIFGESVFFRASDRIFEYRNGSIQTYNTSSEWRFLKLAGNRLFAQDKTFGLLHYRNHTWLPVATKALFGDDLISGIVPISADSFLITTLHKGLFVLHNESISKLPTAIDDELQRNQIYIAGGINKNEFVAGTTSEGCIVMNFNGQVVQKLSHTDGLQNNNILCLFLDRNQNLWAGLNNGISFIAYNSAIKYIRPNNTNELAGYSTRIFNNKLYIATSDGTHVVPLQGDNTDLSFSKGSFSQIKNSSGQVWRLDEVNQQLLMGYNDGAFVIRDNEAVPIMQGKGAWLFVPSTPVFPSANVLVGTYTGLQLFQYEHNNFKDQGRIDGIFESFRFLAIDNNNDVWSSHPYRGIFKIQLSADQKKFSSQLFTEKDGLPATLGNYAFKIQNRVVFATEKGLYEFDAEKKRFIVSPTLGKIFGTMELRYLNEDADGNIWFCSGKKPGVVNFGKPANGNPYTITYFPELTGQILSGFENIYPYNKENIFIGSEKGMIHLDYEKYLRNDLKLSVMLGQVRAMGSDDTILSGGYARLLGGKKPELAHGFNSFHFEYSSPAFGLQNSIEYSYMLEGYDDKWSAWSARTEKDYTNLPHGNYVFKVKAHDNLGHESEPVLYPFSIRAAWYRSNWAWLLYVVLFALGIQYLAKYQQQKLQRQQKKFDEEQARLKYIHQLELEKNEKEIIKLQNEKLANDVQFKNRELADATMHLVERSDALAKVKEELQKLYKNTGNNHDVKKTIQFLNDVEKNNSNWDQFASHFDEVNNDFLKKLKGKFPNLSNNDLKVCAYLQLNLSSKEIAQLANISLRGVEISRYRLRKKLQVPGEVTLNDFLTKATEA
ncbi:MAG: transcriptional regulator [Ferruginibacter sp.]|nr:transcriptional regulator [Ferruginibacter sp.]